MSGIAALLSASLLLAGCQRRDARLSSLAATEPSPPSAERIRELRALIEEYGEVVTSKVHAASRQADYLRLLAVEYLRQELYGPALAALEEAIVITPRNHVLHQLAGAASGHSAKAQGRAEERMAYYSRAEAHYLRSVELSPGYIDGLYGLAVLYVFELGRPLAAVEYLDQILSRSANHTPALFVLARARVELGEVDRAVAAYDRIIAQAPDQDSRARARRNRQLLLGGSP